MRLSRSEIQLRTLLASSPQTLSDDAPQFPLHDSAAASSPLPNTARASLEQTWATIQEQLPRQAARQIPCSALLDEVEKRVAPGRITLKTDDAVPLIVLYQAIERLLITRTPDTAWRILNKPRLFSKSPQADHLGSHRT